MLWNKWFYEITIRRIRRKDGNNTLLLCNQILNHKRIEIKEEIEKNEGIEEDRKEEFCICY